MNKTEQKAKQFLKHIQANPNERFWQALWNFTELPYILISDRPPIGQYKNTQGEEINLKDTYYLED